MPEARPPAILAHTGREDPIARNPEVAVGRRGTRRSRLQTLRRRLGVPEFRHRRRCPETGDPLETSARRLPVTRYPATVGRHTPPHAADPDVVATLVIPKPIAGNPDHVVALRLPIRRDLVNRIRGRLGATTPGCGSGLTCSANASWTGPRKNIQILIVGLRGGAGPSWRGHQFRFLARSILAKCKQDECRWPPAVSSRHVCFPGTSQPLYKCIPRVS